MLLMVLLAVVCCVCLVSWLQPGRESCLAPDHAVGPPVLSDGNASSGSGLWRARVRGMHGVAVAMARGRGY